MWNALHYERHFTLELLVISLVEEMGFEQFFEFIIVRFNTNGVGQLNPLVGAYTLKLWLAKVLFFVCGTSSCCIRFSDHSPGLLTDFSVSRSWR